MKIFWPNPWLARDGYGRFCAETQLPEEDYYGLELSVSPKEAESDRASAN